MARLGRSQPQSTRVRRPKVSAIPVAFAGTFSGSSTLTGALKTIPVLKGTVNGIGTLTGPGYEIGGTLIDDGFNSGTGNLGDAWTIYIDPEGTGGQVIYDANNQGYLSSTGALSTKAAKITAPSYAGQGTIASISPSSWTTSTLNANGAELRWWSYIGADIDKHEITDNFEGRFSNTGAFWIRHTSGNVQILSNRTNPPNTTGYGTAGVYNIGTYSVETLYQYRVIFNFTNTTYTVWRRTSITQPWTQLYTTGASSNLPMYTNSSYVYTNLKWTCGVPASINASVWVDEVQYSNSGISDSPNISLKTIPALSGAPQSSSSITGGLKVALKLFAEAAGVGSVTGALTIEPATAEVTLIYQEDDEPVATTTIDYALLEYADGDPLDSAFMTLLQKGTAMTDSEGYLEVSTSAAVQGTVVYFIAILPDGDPTDQMVWTLKLNEPTTFYINNPNRNSGSLTLHVPIFDVIPPTVNISVVSVSKISRVAGKDSTDVTFTVDEPCQGWKAKVVASNGATHTQGTLIESGSSIVPATPVEFNITDDEFVAASAEEGTNIVKIFVQDSAGNWSV